MVQQHTERQMASSFKVTENIGVLSSWKSEARNTDNSKEVNKVSWNERNPVVDIRSWWVDETGVKKPGKGITLNDREARKLCEYLISCGYNEKAVEEQ